MHELCASAPSATRAAWSAACVYSSRGPGGALVGARGDQQGQATAVEGVAAQRVGPPARSAARGRPGPGRGSRTGPGPTRSRSINSVEASELAAASASGPREPRGEPSGKEPPGLEDCSRPRSPGRPSGARAPGRRDRGSRAAGPRSRSLRCATLPARARRPVPTRARARPAARLLDAGARDTAGWPSASHIPSDPTSSPAAIARGPESRALDEALEQIAGGRGGQQREHEQRDLRSRRSCAGARSPRPAPGPRRCVAPPRGTCADLDRARPRASAEATGSGPYGPRRRRGATRLARARAPTEPPGRPSARARSPPRAQRSSAVPLGAAARLRAEPTSRTRSHSSASTISARTT